MGKRDRAVGGAHEVVPAFRASLSSSTSTRTAVWAAL
jgi:hypothetical protein